MPCTCGTIIDEMLIAGPDDEMMIKPVKKDDLPDGYEKKK